MRAVWGLRASRVAATVAACVGLLSLCGLGIAAATGAFDQGPPPTGYLQRLAAEAGYGTTWDRCAATVQPDPDLDVRWREASDTALVVCLTESGIADGALRYARFETEQRMRESLVRSPPGHDYCSFDLRIVIADGAPRFAEMCAAHGASVQTGR